MGNRFYTDLTVRFEETDLQGHVFFGNYFSYFDVGLVEYQKAVSYPYQQMVADGVDMVYLNANCDFKAAAQFDETLRVYCEVERLGNSSLRFAFEIVRPADEQQVALGSITAVTLDHDTRTSVRVPEAFRTAITDYQGSIGDA